MRAAALFLFAATLSCTTDVAGPSVDDAEARAGATTPQGLDTGSCAEACGDLSADGCWCDDACADWGDCCPDYERRCVMPAGACVDDADCGEREECVQVQCITTPCWAMCTPTCPAIEMLCAPNALPEDTDGDGCAESCVPQCATAIRCAGGYHGEDSDGDGCHDTCAPDVPACDEDADCPGGYCESFMTCMAIGCPPPPPNQCVPADCDDDSVLMCRRLPPTCEAGHVLALRDGCQICVDARTCEAPPPPPDSCVDRCGGQAPDGCWCDESCATYGDCCADVDGFCSF